LTGKDRRRASLQADSAAELKKGKNCGKVGDTPTELIKMEKWQEKWTVSLVPGGKTTELIKMGKWRGKWTVSLVPGEWDKPTELIKIEKMAGKIGRCAWCGGTKQRNS
jgi:hypothetical protein